jgi:hypothetical protein
MNISDRKVPTSDSLGLRAGSWVEVRSRAEILATLDDQGRLDALPFMPEMLQYCGKRFRVFKSAHKTCDTIERYQGRSMTNAVHLEGLRCDGEAHGGCQARCLIFWKEAWLKPIPDPASQEERLERTAWREVEGGRSQGVPEVLARAVRAPGPDERYVCQATELLRATVPLSWWDVRQYVKDLTSGNVRLGTFVAYLAIAAYNVVMRLHWRGHPYPYIRGLAVAKTEAEMLNLQAGELVQVRSKAEIMRTLNASQKNRGLWFDAEMVPYCGRTFRVLGRIERLVDEKTGKMLNLRNACIVLDGVVCSGCLSRYRLFCPRSIYPYWREAWLKRVG